MLRLQGISRSYGGLPAVDDVSISAPAGGRTVIVGPSGSGKTTLLRLIAGFETPDGGEIALAGRQLARPGFALPPHRRNIAYVPQEGALFPHLTVAENIGFAIPRKSATRQARIDALLDQVGLTSAMRDRWPHQLSGGQQQRVAVARSLAQEPDLLLLDEPFSALDTGLRDAMRDMLGEVLAKSGTTSVLVTHDQAEALAFADHLVVMRKGRIADAGPPQRLYQRPVDAETARFLGPAIIVTAEIRDGIATTAFGPVRVPDGGSGVSKLLLRPEQFAIGPHSGEGSDQATFRVRDRTFCGAFWKIELEPFDQRDRPDAARVSLTTRLDVQPGDLVRIDLTGTAHVLERDTQCKTV